MPGWVQGFLAARATSAVGTQVTFLALPAAAAAAAPGDARFVAVVEAMTVVGFVVASLPAGVVADRRDPWPTLVLCAVVNAVGMFAVGFALVRLVAQWSVGTAVLVAVLVAVVSCVQTQSEASTQRLVVSAVAPAQRSVLNSWVHGTSSAAQLVGPAVVGALVATVGAAYGLLLDAMTFAGAAVLLLAAQRRYRSAPPAPDARVGTAAPAAPDVSVLPPRVDLRGRWRAAVDEALAGFRALGGLRLLRATTVVLALANLFAGVYGATYVYYVLEVRDLGGSGLAVVGAAGAVGGLAGAALSGRLLARVAPVRVLLVAPAGYAALFLLVGAPDGSLVLPAAGVVVYSFASALVIVAYVTLRQDSSPPELAGRIAAATRAVTNGAYPLSAAVAVVALGLVDASTVMTAAVAGEALTAVLLPWWWWRRRAAGAPAGTPEDRRAEPVGMPAERDA